MSKFRRMFFTYCCLFDLLMQLSGQRTRAPCAVECYAPQEPGSKLGPSASAFHQKIISNTSYAHDKYIY